MSEALRKGWCPGALRPMAAKDGLLVRLRITGGILPAAKAQALADLATRYGNGLFDLSARGNLQLRGVSDATLDALQDGLHDLGLLDADAAAESVRNVIASPLAGLQDGLDIRPIVAALEARLRADATLHALPGKFGFLIDDGGWPSLADVAADVRFDWIAARGHFAIGLGGSRPDAVRVGVCAAADVVARAAAIARGALALLAGSPERRRMRDLVSAHGADVVARACGGVLGDAMPVVASTKARDIVGLHTMRAPRRGEVRPSSPAAQQRGRGTMRSMVEGARDADTTTGGEAHVPPPPPSVVPLPRCAGEDGACLGLAAPFGRLDAAMLRAAAAIAGRTALGEIRLTPWRVLLIPGASDIAHGGFIIDPADPRLAVAACVGADGCERGTTATHDDATRLAAHVAPSPGRDIALHVSGCLKGCAKPSRSALTLVGRDGRYDLVRDGRAGDPPVRRGLDLADALLELT